jgi:hypothetical protein
MMDKKKIADVFYKRKIQPLELQKLVGKKGIALYNLTQNQTEDGAVLIEDKVYRAKAIENISALNEVIVLAYIDDVLLIANTRTNIANFPSEYPLPSNQITALQSVNIQNFPSTYPLPSSQIADLKTINDINKTATPWSITATTSGDNTIKTPATGKKLRVKLIDVWNNGTADITVYLKFGTGTARFKKTLASKTGFIINLLGANWEGATDEPLIINLSANGTVDVTVLGDEI